LTYLALHECYAISGLPDGSAARDLEAASEAVLQG